MNKQQFIQFLKDPSQLSESELDELEGLISNYPYFQSARTLIAKGKKQLSPKTAKKYIGSAAVYVTDRALLKRYIDGQLLFLESRDQPKVKEEISASPATEKPAQTEEEKPAKKKPESQESPATKETPTPSKPKLPIETMSVDEFVADSPEVAKLDNLIEEVYQDLENLRESKARFRAWEEQQEEEEAVNSALEQVQEKRKSKPVKEEAEEELDIVDETEIPEKEAETPSEADLAAELDAPESEVALPSVEEVSEADAEDEIVEADMPEEPADEVEAADEEEDKEVEVAPSPKKATPKKTSTVKSTAKTKETKKPDKKAASATKKTPEPAAKSTTKGKAATTEAKAPAKPATKKEQPPEEKGTEKPKSAKTSPKKTATKAAADVKKPVKEEPEKSKAETTEPEKKSASANDTKEKSAETSTRRAKRKAPIKMKRSELGDVISKRSRGDRQQEESTITGEEDQKKIITEFIDKDPGITPGDKSAPPAKDKPDLSEKSTRFHADIASEYLAEIYIEQGKYDRAVEIYQNLSLKFPQKKSFFASRIEELKKK